MLVDNLRSRWSVVLICTGVYNRRYPCRSISSDHLIYTAMQADIDVSIPLSSVVWTVARHCIRTVAHEVQVVTSEIV
jgi:hypothetical protein